MVTPQPLANPSRARSLRWLLPYSVRVEACADDAARIQARFATYNQRATTIDQPGLFFLAQRRYIVTADDHAIRIGGPYGYKAWTMQTVVGVTPTGNGSMLLIRTWLHRRIALGILEAFVAVGIFAVLAGMPAAPFFPLVLFAPFIYAATVAATKVEAAAIAQLVRRIAHGEELPTLAPLAL
jgi:hypothetical protein